MVAGIFLVLLELMAAVDTNQLHFSDEKGIVCEKERREEILQQLKEQEASLRLLYSLWKKAIADLESKQQVLAWSVLALERKIQQIQHRFRKVLCLAAIALSSIAANSICRKSFVSTVEKKTLMQYSWVKYGKEWFSLTPFALTIGIHIYVDRIVESLCLVTRRLVPLPLKILWSTNKNVVLKYIKNFLYFVSILINPSIPLMK